MMMVEGVRRQGIEWAVTKPMELAESTMAYGAS